MCKQVLFLSQPISQIYLVVSLLPLLLLLLADMGRGSDLFSCSHLMLLGFGYANWCERDDVCVCCCFDLDSVVWERRN